MKRRIVKRVLLVLIVVLIGLAVWTFWVPTRAPGGRKIASGPAYLLIWSPDGRFIQYYYRDHGTPVLPSGDGTLVVRANGSGTELGVAGVGPGGWRRDPVSPVVCEVFGTWPDYGVRLIAVDLETEQMETLDPRFRLRWGGYCAVAPSLSPAARCCSTPDLSKDQLLLLSGDGSQRELRAYPYHPGDGLRYVFWSPDGGSLVVAGSGQIDVVDVATGSGRALLRVSGDPSQLLDRASWSPDGQEIAFAVRDSDLPARVLGWAYNVSAKCITRRTNWMGKPAGVFHDRRENRVRSVVCSVRLRDGRVRQLLRLPKGYTVGDLAWSPDGSDLAAVCDRRGGPIDGSTLRVFEIPPSRPTDWQPARRVISSLRSGPAGSKG